MLYTTNTTHDNTNLIYASNNNSYHLRIHNHYANNNINHNGAHNDDITNKTHIRNNNNYE
jgi:hypothetical protein